MDFRFFDTHAHLDHDRFADDRETAIDRAREAGVVRMLNPGVDLPSSKKALALAEAHSGVFAAVGFSPHDAKKVGQGDLESLRELARGPKVVAWGEIGLDYHYELSPREVQKRQFERQLGIAGELNLPAVFHLRQAEEDFFSILERVGLPEAGGVMHCFTAGREALRRALSLGLCISFTGVITFKSSRDEFAELICRTPPGRLLAETDAPYMAPVPFRGRRCEPSMLEATVRRMAEVLDRSADETAELLWENACRVFGLRPEG